MVLMWRRFSKLHSSLGRQIMVGEDAIVELPDERYQLIRLLGAQGGDDIAQLGLLLGLVSLAVPDFFLLFALDERDFICAVFEADLRNQPFGRTRCQALPEPA